MFPTRLNKKPNILGKTVSSSAKQEQPSIPATNFIRNWIRPDGDYLYNAVSMGLNEAGRTATGIDMSTLMLIKKYYMRSICMSWMYHTLNQTTVFIIFGITHDLD